MVRDIQNFKDLQVWQRGFALTKIVYQLTESFPKSQQYVLANQMQRVALSIPSNIAEGFNRKTTKEYKQFLSIALGSASELETQLLLAIDLGYIPSHHLESLNESVDALSRMLRALIVKLEARVAA